VSELGRHPLAGVTPIVAAGGAASAPFDDFLYQRLLRERIIFLANEVADPMANAICAQMLLLAAEDPEKDIYLYVNSPGGSVSAGMAIYDTMQFIKNDVATVAMGLAASMGQFLLCAGAPGKRYSLPHARIMMHQPSGGIGGTASDIRIQAEQMLYTKTQMAQLIAHHTGQSIEHLHGRCRVQVLEEIIIDLHHGRIHARPKTWSLSDETLNATFYLVRLV
jgi:ATP-dependent Clp protease protease subunit